MDTVWRDVLICVRTSCVCLPHEVAQPKGILRVAFSILANTDARKTEISLFKSSKASRSISSELENSLCVLRWCVKLLKGLRLHLICRRLSTRELWHCRYMKNFILRRFHHQYRVICPSLSCIFIQPRSSNKAVDICNTFLAIIIFLEIALVCAEHKVRRVLCIFRPCRSCRNYILVSVLDGASYQRNIPPCPFGFRSYANDVHILMTSFESWILPVLLPSGVICCCVFPNTNGIFSR